MIENIKTNLAELLTQSTSYGLSSIFKSNKIILKSFWFIYFLIGSVTAVFFLSLGVKNYFEYDVVSRIETSSENSMSFPAVTICPTSYNAFNKKSLDQIIIKCQFNFDSFTFEDCKLNKNSYF